MRFPAEFRIRLVLVSRQLRIDQKAFSRSNVLRCKKAVPKRVEEFSTGRWLAREALKKRNLPTGAIPTGSAREPLWPNGAIGSISHSTPLCGVAIAHANQYRGIGLDLEMAKPPDRDLGTLILSEVERRDYLEAPWLQVVFSAKEAVYKGVYPILHKFLDFHDVAIHLDREAKTFSASARCDAVRTIVASGSGIYELDDSGVATLFTIPAGYLTYGAVRGLTRNLTRFTPPKNPGQRRANLTRPSAGTREYGDRYFGCRDLRQRLAYEISNGQLASSLQFNLRSDAHSHQRVATDFKEYVPSVDLIDAKMAFPYGG